MKDKLNETWNKMVEMPLRMNTDERPLVKGWDPNKWSDIRWESVIGEYNGLTFAQGRMPMGLFGLGILNEVGDGLLCAAKCGMQTISTPEGPVKGPKFIEVATVGDVRGKGYAKALHDFALKKWGMIVSDNGLFETSKDSGDGMIGLWVNYLRKKYKTYVFNEETRKFTPWDGSIDNDENTVYLASTFDL